MTPIINSGHQISPKVIFFLAGLLFADTLLDSVGIIQAADFGVLGLVFWMVGDGLVKLRYNDVFNGI